MNKSIMAVAGLAAGAALGLNAAPASADGYQAKRGYAAPYSWTGCYLGGNVGWIRADDDVRTYPSGRYVDIVTPAVRAEVTRSASLDESGVSGGVQVGCNLQLHSFVVGIEGDYNWSNLDASDRATFGPTAGGFLGRTETLNFSLDRYWTLRGRVGHAWDRLLVYATGGLAGANVSLAHSVVFTNGDAFNGGHNDRLTGWTVGGGFEYAFSGNWSIKAEYLHLRLDDSSSVIPNTLFAGGLPPGDPRFTWTADHDHRENILRVGLNYKFGCCREAPLK